MQAEIAAGGGIALAAAGRLFPGHRGGRHVDPSTVFRWVTRGVMAAGRRVKLEAARVGSRWLTSPAAVSRFVTVLTAAASPADSDPPPASRTPTARSQAAARAAAALKSVGA